MYTFKMVLSLLLCYSFCMLDSIEWLSTVFFSLLSSNCVQNIVSIIRFFDTDQHQIDTYSWLNIAHASRQLARNISLGFQKTINLKLD